MEEPETGATAPARDQGGAAAALLIIDMINTFDFKGGEDLRARAEAIAGPILQLRDAFDAADLPTVYVNDNFGEWHSEKSRLIAKAFDGAADGLARIKPRDCDYFVLKPQFSGFYATNLPVLLPKLGVRRLVLTGVATDICVLFTAGDAHMRDYALWVPEDAVATQDDDRGRWALEIIAQSMGADIAATTAHSPDEWLAEAQHG
nr:isochorismatase family cysteine hydrolase [uncultured Sphingomonas sp.]